jgi:hypothetical protein
MDWLVAVLVVNKSHVQEAWNSAGLNEVGVTATIHLQHYMNMAPLSHITTYLKLMLSHQIYNV